MTVSDAFRSDAWSPESDLHLVLLEISHPDLTNPIRVVNDKTPIISGGVEYIAFPFEISLPESAEDAPPRARLAISNVGREIGETIRSIVSPPFVTITIIRQETPDVIEAIHEGMRLVGVTYDAQAVSGDLVREDFVREPYPAPTYSPAEFEGLVP